MNQNTDTSFKYTYSANEQDEIRRIRQKYEPEAEDKMTRLRKMDESVTFKATMTAVILGVLGTLIMGTGMSLALTNIGMIVGMSEMTSMITGVIAGVMGIVLMVLAYPVYNKMLKKEREKIAPEILRLTEELMK